MYPKSKIIALIFVIALAVGALYLWNPPTSMAPSSDDEISMMSDDANIEPKFDEVVTEEVVYHENISGYLARPDAEGQFPALILIHEWWGLNENIKDFAERFAKQGYVALAVDLYEGQVAKDRETAAQLAGGVRSNLDPAFANLNSAVAYLQERDDVQEKSLASVGWCFGGGWSYEMAVNNLGVDASIMYYGQFDPEDDFKNMRATILGHFGEEDQSILVDDVREFASVLETQGRNHAVYIYPNAGHAFANEDNESAYNEEAAEQSWIRTLNFLDDHLDSSS
jgi:carboxymethylenebutenolidase